MKTIGLLGGVTWRSTEIYYRLLNQGIAQQLGLNYSAKIVLNSIDYNFIYSALNSTNKWEIIEEYLIKEAKKVEAAGADFLLICSFTMHIASEGISNNINIPVIHMLDSIVEEAFFHKFKKISLLGTMFTMEENKFSSSFEEHGLEIVPLNLTLKQTIHRIIYDELSNGIISMRSRHILLGYCNDLLDSGVDAIILGCTELPLLISNESTPLNIPFIDATKSHINTAINFSLSIDDL